jgi:hypothetical protein
MLPASHGFITQHVWAEEVRYVMARNPDTQPPCTSSYVRCAPSQRCALIYVHVPTTVPSATSCTLSQRSCSQLILILIGIQFHVLFAMCEACLCRKYLVWSLKICITSGFWPRVRVRALRAPVFLGSLPRQMGAARPPPAHRSFSASYSTTKNIYNLSNLGCPRQRLFSIHWTTEAMK